jgi:hypothetical protein
MPSGGKRPGAGRRKGQESKKKVALRTASTIAGVTPREVMLTTMGLFWARARLGSDGQPLPDGEFNISDARAACEIAKDAAPYCHARLVTQQLETKPGSALEMNMNVRGAVSIYLPENKRRSGGAPTA